MLPPGSLGFSREEKPHEESDIMNTERNIMDTMIFLILSSLSVTQLDSGVQRKFLNGGYGPYKRNDSTRTIFPKRKYFVKKKMNKAKKVFQMEIFS